LPAISFWNFYRDIVYKNCATEPDKNDALNYWRNNLFAATILYLIPLSLLALIPGIYLAILENLIFIVIADILGILSLAAVAFVPGIPVFYRKLIFCAALYLVSVALLFYLGSFGPGLLYLLAITVFIVLIFEKKYGFWAVAINALVCIIFGFAIHFEWWDNPILSMYDLRSWLTVTSNLVFLSFLAALLIPILFDGLQQTIQEQYRLRDELEEKNRELEDFAYTASHDMKEPLRMVRSFLKLLDDRYSDIIDEKGKKYIHFAVTGAEKMTSFIDDLLEYSRAGRLNLAFEETDVSLILDDISESLTNKVLNQEAVISYSDMPVINAVPVSIKMLFYNLVSNALKYQEAGNSPEINITCEDSDMHWQFNISDNGIGIDEIYHEQIFQLFKRLHSNDAYSGTGMGLAICRKIVQHHGGRIWVESRSGAGTTFRFTLKK
jgi:signal transduction histidine kinase